MTLMAERTITADEFASDPDLAGYELVDGQLREKVVSEHSCDVGVEILVLLRTFAKQAGQAKVYSNELGYRCFESADTVRFPDVSVVRMEKKGQIGNDPGYMPIPADLVVEVVSPNDLTRKVNEKVKSYLAAGFGLVWVADPDWRYVHVYRPDGSIQLFTENDEITGEQALPGFRAKVADFFAV